MAVQKNFVVKNGIEVNNNLIFADTNSNKVGIATTNPRYNLHVSGGIGATHSVITGFSTVNNLTINGRVAAGTSQGASGQYLVSTGVGVTWVTIPRVRIIDAQTASAGVTTFNTTYSLGLLDVYINGVRLSESEFTALDGATVTLNDPCFGGETVEFISFSPSSVGVSGTDTLGITVLDEGTPVGTALKVTSVNFVGASVTAVGSGIGVTVYLNDTVNPNYWESTSAGINTISNVGLGTTNPRFALEVGPIGASGTSLLVNGDARVINTLSIGSSSIIINGQNNTVSVGPSIFVDGNDGSIFANTLNLNGETLVGAGVTYITAGSGISVDQNDGNVTITATGGGGGDSQWVSTDVGIHTLSNVGVGTTNPRFALEVGAVGASGTSLLVNGDTRITGILTVGSSSITLNGDTNTLNVGSGVTISGDTGSISVTSLNINGQALTGSGVTYITAGSGISVDQNDGNVTISANQNYVSSAGIATYADTAGISTTSQGLTGTPNIEVGVVTATSFIGDGSGLTGVVGTGSGIEVRDDGSTVGTASTIDFGANLSVSPISSGIVTVTAAGGGGSSQWETTAAGIHTLSSVGIGTTNPTTALTVNGVIQTGVGSNFTLVASAGFTGDGPEGRYLQLAYQTNPNYILNNIGIGTTNATSRLTVKGNTFLETLNVSGVSTFAGSNVKINAGNSLDFGTGAGDLHIYKQSGGGSDSIIKYDGSFNFKVLSDITTLASSTGSVTWGVFGNNGVELYYSNSKKFETLGTGVTVTGTTFTNQLSVSGVSTFRGSNSTQVHLGNTGYYAGITWSGVGGVYGGTEPSIVTNSGLGLEISGGLGDLTLSAPTSGGDVVIKSGNLSPTAINCVGNAQVELYNNGNKKLETTATGVTVTGTTSTNQLSVSGVGTFGGSSSGAVDIKDNISQRTYISPGAIQFNDTGSIQQIGATQYYRASITGSSDSVYYFSNYYGGFDHKVFYVDAQGATELYFDESKKFETIGAGVTVTGTTFTNQLNVSGVSSFAGITTVTGPTLFTKQLNVSGVSTIGGPLNGVYFTNIGGGNIAIGQDSLLNHTFGFDSIGIGYRALYNASNSNFSNIAIGYQAGYNVTNGVLNSFFGYNSGRLITGGSGNLILGSFDGNSFGLDIRNADNYIVLSANGQTGSNDTAPKLVIDPNGNTGIGTVNPLSGYNLTVGTSSSIRNTSLKVYGYGDINGLTIKGNSSAYIDNVIITQHPATSFTGGGNVAIGDYSFTTPGAAGSNVAIGYYALNVVGNNDTGNTYDGNVGVGAFAGQSITTTLRSTFIGYGAGRYVTTGSENTILGAYDGNQNGLDIRTSSNNVVLSDGAGNIRFYANSSGNVGLGTTNPTSALTVVGSGASLSQLYVTGISTFNTTVYTNDVYVGDADRIFFGNNANLTIGYETGNGESLIRNQTSSPLIVDLASNNGSTLTVRTGFGNTLAYVSRTNVQLYESFNKKFETIGAGVTVTGTTFTNQLNVSGVSTFSGLANLTQITETVVNAFNTTLSPSTGTLTIDTSLGTVVLGDLDASVTTWAFTNVPTANSKATTITVIIDGDTAQTYGDACSVNGSAVSNGVKWSGGSAPTATNNFDIITFTIVKDSGGTINVFGSGNTDFS